MRANEGTGKEEHALRIVPLGGLNETGGRNMLAIEYAGHYIIVDAGLSFDTRSGEGYLVPNTSFFRREKEAILGVLLTHGHYDHMGALPHIMREIGNPVVYATPFTEALIRRRQESDFKDAPKLRVQGIDKEKLRPFTLGPFEIEPFHVNHSIPDAIGFAIHTPVGTLVHTGDFKFDDYPVGSDEPPNRDHLRAIGDDGVLALLSDSTNAKEPGRTMSESVIMENLDHIFRETRRGRIFVSMFSSQISRQQQVLWLCEDHHRVAALGGYSMQKNFEDAERLDHIRVPKGVLASVEDIMEYPPQEAVILCTGAQGEERAALARIAKGGHHEMYIERGDSVVFSASIIPGNEASVAKVKAHLRAKGVHIIDYNDTAVHASGHARADDLKEMIDLIEPQYLIPIHGERAYLDAHAQLGQELGISRQDTLVAYDGALIELNQEEISVRDTGINTKPRYIEERK